MSLNLTADTHLIQSEPAYNATLVSIDLSKQEIVQLIFYIQRTVWRQPLHQLINNLPAHKLSKKFVEVGSLIKARKGKQSAEAAGLRAISTQTPTSHEALNGLPAERNKCLRLQ
jgi:hypothetical protein